MDSRNLDISVILPNLAALLFVAVGLVTQRPALVSERPNHGTPNSFDGSVLKVDARLWQDPLKSIPVQPANGGSESLLKAVQKYFNAAKPLDDGVLQFRENVEAALEESRTHRKTRRDAEGKGSVVGADSPTLLLPVLIDSTQYAEAREQRLRARYAILSALGRAQYIPRDETHLHFAFIDLEDGGPKIAVPYEIYSVRAAIADRVSMPGHPSDWTSYSDSLSSTPDLRNKLTIFNAYDQVVVIWLDENRLAQNTEEKAGAGDQENRPALSTSGSATVRSCEAAASISKRTLLGRVDLLMQRLVSVEKATSWTADMRVIGPTSSRPLEQILEESADERFCPAFRLKNPVRVLSARATASDEVFAFAYDYHSNFYPPGNSAKEKPHFPHIQSAGPVQLTPRAQSPSWILERTIASDEKLVAGLLKELDLRAASPGSDEKNHIAIVGEWDSLYARSISRTFAHELSKTFTGDEGLVKRQRWLTSPVNIHEFSYLRGMDGQSGGQRMRMTSLDVPPPEDEAAHEKEKKAETQSALERPDGEWQFDYLRRLGEELYYLDTRIKRENKGKLTAIGVLGSDVYDKLLVLRALRAQFPSVIFFTTDMDALYLDPQESKWTRNLVVASAYGLTTSELFQDRIPPFRDGYQTALFLTTLLALNVENIKSESIAATPPSIFEIGRSEAHRLNIPRRTTLLVPGSRVSRMENPYTFAALAIIVLLGAAAFLIVHQNGFFNDFARVFVCLGALPGAWSVMVATLAALRLAGDKGAVLPRNLITPLLFVYGGAFLVLLGSFFLGLFKRGSVGSRLKAVLLSFGWLGLVVAVSAPISYPDLEERFSLFEGISIWPTEILRSVALITAICFLIIMRQKLLELRCWVNRELLGQVQAYTNEPPTKLNPVQPSHGLMAKLQSAFPSIYSSIRRTRKNDAELSEQTIFKAASQGRPGPEKKFWLYYLKVTSAKRRRARVIIFSTVYLALSFSISIALGFPNVPARGIWSRCLDSGILLTTVITYVVLLFNMVDAVAFSAGMIRRLSKFIPIQKSLLCETESTGIINEVVTVLTRLIYFPFTIVFILIVSRNSIFDCWDWPLSLIITFCLGLVMIVVSLIVLQGAARHAKHSSLEYINTVVLDCLAKLRTLKNGNTSAVYAHPSAQDIFYPEHADIETQEKYLRDRLEHFRERRRVTESYDGAAFQPWYKNPVFTAMLIPFTGVGSIAAIEHIVELFGRG